MTKEYDLKDESEFWNLYFDELSKAIESVLNAKSEVMKMQILFDADTKEVIATVGTEKDFVKNPYVLLDLGDKEPTFAWRNGKLVFIGVVKKRGNTKRKGKPIEGNNESYNCENWIP